MPGTLRGVPCLPSGSSPRLTTCIASPAACPTQEELIELQQQLEQQAQANDELAAQLEQLQLQPSKGRRREGAPRHSLSTASGGGGGGYASTLPGRSSGGTSSVLTRGHSLQPEQQHLLRAQPPAGGAGVARYQGAGMAQSSGSPGSPGPAPRQLQRASRSGASQVVRSASGSEALSSAWQQQRQQQQEEEGYETVSEGGPVLRTSASLQGLIEQAAAGEWAQTGQGQQVQYRDAIRQSVRHAMRRSNDSSSPSPEAAGGQQQRQQQHGSPRQQVARRAVRISSDDDDDDEQPAQQQRHSGRAGAGGRSQASSRDATATSSHQPQQQGRRAAGRAQQGSRSSIDAMLLGAGSGTGADVSRTAAALARLGSTSRGDSILAGRPAPAGSLQRCGGGGGGSPSSAIGAKLAQLSATYRETQGRR